MRRVVLFICVVGILISMLFAKSDLSQEEISRQVRISREKTGYGLVELYEAGCLVRESNSDISSEEILQALVGVYFRESEGFYQRREQIEKDSEKYFSQLLEADILDFLQKDAMYLFKKIATMPDYRIDTICVDRLDTIFSADGEPREVVTICCYLEFSDSEAEESLSGLDRFIIRHKTKILPWINKIKLSRK